MPRAARRASGYWGYCDSQNHDGQNEGSYQDDIERI